MLCTTSCICTCHLDFKNSFILATSELHKTNVDSYTPIKWLVYLNSIDAALQQDVKCHIHSMVMHKSIKQLSNNLCILQTTYDITDMVRYTVQY